MAEYKVWNYDVWGNDEDGFTVNDRNEIGSVDLPDDPTDAQILEAISEYWDTDRLTIDDSADFGDGVIEIIVEETEEPVGQLVRE